MESRMTFSRLSGVANMDWLPGSTRSSHALAALNGRMSALFRSTIGSMSSETNALVPTLIATPASMSVPQFGIISACPGWMCATGSLLAFTKCQVGLGGYMATTIL